jgi:hypothetical protein
MVTNKLFRALFILLFSFALLAQLSNAQLQTQSILYLKNGSFIRCNIVSILRDRSITIQKSDTNRQTFSFDQIDSLVYSPTVLTSLTPKEHSKPPAKAKRSTSGLFFGGVIPIDKKFNGGITLGMQFGSGLNPGFLFQLGYDGIGRSGIKEGNIMLSAVIGLRFGRPYDTSAIGIFITPLVGGLAFWEVLGAFGCSLDVYPARNLFIKVQLLKQINDPTKHYLGPQGAVFQLALGCGVN